MKIKLQLILILSLFISQAFGQAGSGGIAGVVTGEDGKPVDYATVRAFSGGLTKGLAYTEPNGYYVIKPLSAGEYDLIVSNGGVPDTIKGITVYSDGLATQNVKLGGKKYVIDGGVITGNGKKLDPDKILVDGKGAKQIQRMSGVSTQDAFQTIGGTQGTGGNSLSIGGARPEGTLYIIDGMPVLGTRATNLSPRLLQNAGILSTGMSAKFGNASGGVAQLTSRGVSSDLSGGLQAQTSVDGYFNNFVAIDLSGPLAYRKNKINNQKIPVLGFVFGLNANYNKDPNPQFNRYYILKPELLSDFQQNPLIANPNGSGSFIERAETVTKNDLTTIRARQNGESKGLNYLGKLDFAPSSRTNITLGTYFDYSKARGYSLFNSVFAPDANSISTNYSARAFLRLTQTLGKTDTSGKPQLFSNAYYTIQASYQREYSLGSNPVHKRNTFDYGYVGKFTQERSPFYISDTAMGIRGLKYVGDFNSALTFTRGGKNPLLENYTDIIMNDPRYDVNNLITLQALGGLINGGSPNSAYSLFTGVGAQITSYSYGQEDKVNVNLDASFDLRQGIKNKNIKSPITHQIEFGGGYEQRMNRGYGLGASGLWSLMRLITNRHIQNLDLDNPIYVVGGQNYTHSEILAQGPGFFSEFDTIKYNRLYVASDQSGFDKALRKKLYGDEKNLSFIDVFDLDPSTFTLDMFTANDLFNQGNSYVNYNGYDHLGNIIRKQASFNDFWTSKDANGNYLRPIAAFNPNYMFGYISDRFTYKDIRFSFGLRVDRYDANQKVLKDPYSFYGVRTVNQIGGASYKIVNGASDPLKAGFDPELVPYVDNNQSTNPTIVGYRKNDTWYDPFGREIADPTTLSENYANGLPIQPWLISTTDSIKSENFKIDNSFADYKPDVALSPRVQFSFPISETSLFYGNYDIVTQNPSGNNFVTPDDYYYVSERRTTLNNANLRMERAINYTLGYSQSLSSKSNSVVGLRVYYRERKDQIQLRQYLLAYPFAYNSYGNRDFSTVKGFIFSFEKGGNKDVPIDIDANYTLQFAEGTGSSSTTSASLIASGQPNLRTLMPLNVDSRHTLNFIVDYRYPVGAKKGPKIGNSYLFGGAGANLQFQARSGGPYTRSSIATPLTGGDFNSTLIQGTINGSRLPWFTDLRLRLDKTILLNTGNHSKGDGENVSSKLKKPFTLNIYTYAQNLLNTKNVIGVYRYTGSPNDDGYLESPQGIQALNTSYLYPQSYEDLYRIRLNSGNLGAPRRIFVGFTISF